MSLRPLVLAAILTGVLFGMVSGYTHEIKAIAQSARSIQSSEINLNFSELNQPLWLEITGLNGSQVQGQVKLNGQVIKTIKGSSNQVDLSNYLRRGNYEVTVQGNYSPSQGSVLINLKGKNIQVMQEIGGNGLLDQQLNLEVR